MMTAKKMEGIIKQLENPMYRLALMFMKDAHHARDVVQEALIRIWKNRDKISEIDNLKAWALRITRNLCIDEIRKRKEHLQPLESSYGMASKNHNPVDQTIITDQMKWFYQALMSLNEKQRQAITYREIEGHSYQEIADMMQENINQIKILIYRGRIKMKEFITKKNEYGV